MQRKFIALRASAIHSTEAAEYVLERFFSEYSLEEIENHISDCAISLPEEMDRALEQLPNIMKQDSIFWLAVPGNANTKYENGEYLQIASIFSLLKYIVRKCWSLFGRDIHEEKEVNWEFSQNSFYTDLKEVSERITLQDIVSGVHFATLQVIGNLTHENYIKRIKEINPLTEADYLELELEMPRGIHATHMVDYRRYKIFLDALFYFLNRVSPASKPASLN